MEREGVTTLSIRSFLRALRCLAHFEIPCALCVFFKSIFKFQKGNFLYDNSCINPQEC